MEITEKVYIEWLERTVKKYKENICDHCPKEWEIDLVTPGNICAICNKLTEKYMEIKDIHGWCPCHYFKVDEDINMVKVAWKVIRGWKKDNKEE